MFAGKTSNRKHSVSTLVILSLQLLAMITMMTTTLCGDASAAMSLEGYVSATDEEVLEEKDVFLAEVSKKYPCWESVTRQSLVWNKESNRKKHWDDATFYGRMSQSNKKKIELLAASYGISL